MLRRMMALVLAATITVALAGCGALADALAGPEKGSCVAEATDGSFDVVECDAAELKVLDVVTGTDNKGCVEVPAVTASYSTGGADTLCIGPVDADPETAINVATKGDCFTGMDGDVADVRRVECEKKAAEAVVLKVLKDANSMIQDACTEVPGTTSSYTWSLDLNVDGTADVPDLSDDLLFCLGPVGVDPEAAVELARAGDCLEELPDAQGYAIVDCGSPEAALKVVKHVDSGVLGVEIACQDAQDATSGIEGGSALNGWVLCVSDV